MPGFITLTIIANAAQPARYRALADRFRKARTAAAKANATTAPIHNV